MKKLFLLFAAAALFVAAPACQQSYTEKAQSGETGHRDEDMDETGKSVHDQADGGMGDHENRTESNPQ